MAQPTPFLPQSLTFSPYTLQGKERLLYDQNQYDRRVKVPELRSKIYTHLKSHLIPFQKMFGKTAVLKVSENFQQRDLTSVLFEHLELSNLPPTYLKNWFQHKCFLWVFRQFLRLLKSLFTKVANRRKFCSKKIFGKLPGRPARVLKKNSAMDVLMGRLTQKNASDWMNRKSQRNE